MKKSIKKTNETRPLPMGKKTRRAFTAYVCLVLTVMKAENGLEKPSVVLLEQIHTIDKQRLQRYIGRASDKALAGIEYALAISLGFIDPVTKTIEIGLCSTCKDLLSRAGAFSIESKNTACTCSRCGFPKGAVYKIKQKGGS